MKSFCYIDGKIIPLEKAKIGAGDIAVMRGFGIYDGIKMYGGKPFRYDDHWKRFENSAKSLGMNIPMTKNKLLGAIGKLSNKFKNNNPNLKLYLTGGPTLNSIEFDKDKCKFFAVAEESVPVEQKLVKNGCRVITAQYKRTYPRTKTINYITAVTLQNKRKNCRALEILYVFDGKVLECSTSNFFIVKKGVIITSKNDVLCGITRKAVIEIAKKNKIKVEEREVSWKETLNADETFLTSSYKEVVPVTKIDNEIIANGRPGPISQKLAQEFKKLTLQK